MFTDIAYVLGQIRARLFRLREDDSGYVTEAVLVTALLAAAAIVIIAIIIAKVTEKANGITL